MKRRASIAGGIALLVCVWTIALSPSASAQTAFEQDLRGQAYVFGGPVAWSEVGSTV